MNLWDRVRRNHALEHGTITLLLQREPLHGVVAGNAMPGGFDPDRVPFGPVTCMVCGHDFTRDDYLDALSRAAARRRPGSNVIPLRRN